MTNRYDNALKLRAIITTHGTGGQMDDIEFRLLRAEFFDDPATKRLLPGFVRDSVTRDDVWAYLKDHHTGEGAYAARRKHIAAQFKPLLDFCQTRAHRLTPVSPTPSRTTMPMAFPIFGKRR